MNSRDEVPVGKWHSVVVRTTQDGARDQQERSRYSTCTLHVNLTDDELRFRLSVNVAPSCISVTRPWLFSTTPSGAGASGQSRPAASTTRAERKLQHSRRGRCTHRERLPKAMCEDRYDRGGGCCVAWSESCSPRESMSHDTHESEKPAIYEQGATEEQTEKIEAIVGDEVLGYDGSGRGEHSGQSSAPDAERSSGVLADNRPEQLK